MDYSGRWVVLKNGKFHLARKEGERLTQKNMVTGTIADDLTAEYTKTENRCMF